MQDPSPEIPADDDLLRLRSIGFEDMEQLHAQAREGRGEWPLCILLGFAGQPLAVSPTALSFVLNCRRSRVELRLGGLSYRPSTGDREIHCAIPVTAELTALAAPPGLPRHRILVVARSGDDEQALDRFAFELLAADCALRGEWRLMHLLEWDLVKRNAGSRLLPVTRRRLPATYRWRLLGPALRDVRQGALWLEWVLLHARQPGATPVPQARVLTLSDGTPVQVEAAPAVRMLGLFPAGGDGEADLRPRLALSLSADPAARAVLAA